MKHALLATTATAALAALFIGSGAFAQETQQPKQPQAEEQMPAKPAAKNRVGETDCKDQDANCLPKKKMGAQPADTQKPKDEATDEATPRKKPKVGQGAEEPKAPKAAEDATTAKPKVGQKGAEEPSAPKATEDTTTARPKVGQQDEEATEPGKKKKPVTGAATPQQEPGKPADETKTGQTQTGGAGGSVEVTGSLKIAPDKATRVRDTLIRSGERTDIDVTVNIGTTLPARVRPRPLPTTIIEIAPEYRGYDYIIVRDEIVIVEPSSRKVVEIIHQGGGKQATRAKGLRLTDAQRRMIRDYAKQHRVQSVQTEVDLDSGASVPSEVNLMPLPDTIVTEVPEIRSYQFFVEKDQVVLVDPQTRAVVEVVE